MTNDANSPPATADLLTRCNALPVTVDSNGGRTVIVPSNDFDELLSALSSLPATADRPCTCHPDDNPPVPCPKKYALSECRAAAWEVWTLKNMELAALRLALLQDRERCAEECIDYLCAKRIRALPDPCDLTEARKVMKDAERLRAFMDMSGKSYEEMYNDFMMGRLREAIDAARQGEDVDDL